jgi:hypothetical protein
VRAVAQLVLRPTGVEVPFRRDLGAGEHPGHGDLVGGRGQEARGRRGGRGAHGTSGGDTPRASGGGSHGTSGGGSQGASGGDTDETGGAGEEQGTRHPQGNRDGGER